MKKQYNDEQLDQMMRTLVRDATADDGLLEEISDSPATWWAVRRAIDSEKETSKAPWPPANIVRRWLLIAVPAAAAVAVIVFMLILKPAPAPHTAQLPDPSEAVTTSIAPQLDPIEVPKVSDEPNIATKVIDRNDDFRPANASRSLRIAAKRPARSVQLVTTRPEIKTDFIALSYAPSAESGHLVRVKVPGSMMVSLGVLASVARPSALVDAEVLVGDDGLTRAIRFIRQ